MARDLTRSRRRRTLPPPIVAERTLLPEGTVFASPISDRARAAVARKGGARASAARRRIAKLQECCGLVGKSGQVFDHDAERLVDASTASIRELNPRALDAALVVTTHGLYYVIPSLGTLARWSWTESEPRLVRPKRLLSEVELRTASDGTLTVRMAYFDAVNLLAAAASRPRSQPPS